MPGPVDDLVDRLRARPSALAHEAADEIVRQGKLILKYERDIARLRIRSSGAGLDPDVGGFRADDPATSVDAAYTLNIEYLKYAVLTTLRDANTPLNCSEIAERLETTRDTISPRMPSLRNMGLIEADGLRLWPPSNRSQIAYVLTAKGRQAVLQRALA